jgi:hypothetical protein
MTNVLRFVPGQLYQGADEELSYAVTVTNWATTPAAACCTIWENSTNRSASNLQASASAGPTIAGAVITTPCIVNLRVGIDYRVKVRLEQSGKAYEGHFYVTGET